MDHSHLQSIELGNRVLKWRNRNEKLGFKKRKKKDKFGVHTPCTTIFTLKSQELGAQEI